MTIDELECWVLNQLQIHEEAHQRTYMDYHLGAIDVLNELKEKIND